LSLTFQPLPSKPQHRVGRLFAHELVETGDARLGQEQTALVTQHDALRERAVLVLLELELAQVALGLLAVTDFGAFLSCA
jgi:hypothetical protein